MERVCGGKRVEHQQNKGDGSGNNCGNVEDREVAMC